MGIEQSTLTLSDIEEAGERLRAVGRRLRFDPTPSSSGLKIGSDARPGCYVGMAEIPFGDQLGWSIDAVRDRCLALAGELVSPDRIGADGDPCGGLPEFNGGRVKLQVIVFVVPSDDVDGEDDGA